MGLSTWAWHEPFGLLRVVDLPPAAHFIAGFLLLDLTFYYWHRLNHTFRLLWRFHNVHHLDPDLDVSTSFRFHWGEILYSTGFRAVQVVAIGVSPTTLVVYELVFQCCTMFHHSNVRLPFVLERVLNLCFVTPRMHGVHHSVVKDEANSNYSVVFSWWDRLNLSLRVSIPQANVIIGVAGYARKEDNRFWQLMLAPFVKQRNYERWPDGTVAGRESASEGVSPTVMSE